MFLLNAITVVSQNSLTGTIQDFDTGERLQYANISLLNSPLEL